MSSHNRQTRLGLAALLLTTCLGTSGWAQAADEAQSKGKIEARSELFAKDHTDQFTSWKGTSESRERTDALAEDPQMVVLWAGYPFSKDYNKPRGHFYALTDVRETLRTGAPKTAEDGPLPMACWSCKGPDVARVIDDLAPLEADAEAALTLDQVDVSARTWREHIEQQPAPAQGRRRAVALRRSRPLCIGPGGFRCVAARAARGSR